MRRFKGFTLTELMVALAVIGIIVAVVTPAIVRMRPNKTKMMVKKTFYTTEQIVSTLINDSRMYPDYHLACDLDEGAVDYDCAWGFDYEGSVRHEGEDYSGDDKFAGLFISMLNIKSGSGADDEDKHIVTTNDGVTWDLSGTVGAWSTGHKNSVKDAGIGEILIDVNGLQDHGGDGPDCRENDSGCSAEDFDQYVIEVFANGKMQISEDDEKAIEYATFNTSIRDN